MENNDIKNEIFKEKEKLLSLFKGFIIKNDKKKGKSLKNSDLIKKIDIKKSSNQITFSAPTYITNVDEGRKRGGKKVPIKELLKFIKENNIQPKKGGINSLAFAIQNSIYKEGIAPRNFLKQSLIDLKREIDKITDIVLNDELNKI